MNSSKSRQIKMLIINVISINTRQKIDIFSLLVGRHDVRKVINGSSENRTGRGLAPLFLGKGNKK